MISMLRYVIQLLDVNRENFAAWEREVHAEDIRLTSAPWVGWHEDVDDSSLFG